MDYRALARELIEKLCVLHRTGPQRVIDESLQGELFVLNFLYSKEVPILPGEISKVMKVSSARIAQTLNSLEKKQWVIREIDPRDRRKILVSLTEEGKHEAIRGREARDQLVASILEQLGEADALEYVRLTEKFIEGISKMRGEI